MVSFERSGTLPCNLYVTCNAQTLALELPFVDRIRQLHFGDSGVLPLLSVVAANPSLEVIVIGFSTSITPTMPPSAASVELLSLHTLLVRNFVYWRDWTMGQLRHLVIDLDHFGVHEIKGLYQVLSSNPYLQELALRARYTGLQDNDLDALELHAPVRVSALKRLYVNEYAEDDDEPTLIYLLDRTLVLGAEIACAYSFIGRYELPDGDWPSRFAKAYPATRVCIDKGRIMGTDGVSAFCFSSYTWFTMHWFHDPRSFSPGPHPTKELAILSSVQEIHTGATDHLQTLLHDMQSVQTLSLSRGIHDWLALLFGVPEYLPNLVELAIHASDDHATDDLEALIAVVQTRKAVGTPIPTLRFVGPFIDGEEGEEQSLREMFVAYVGDVVFEDARPIRFDFPSVCDNSSSVHSHNYDWTNGLIVV